MEARYSWPGVLASLRRLASWSGAAEGSGALAPTRVFASTGPSYAPLFFALGFSAKTLGGLQAGTAASMERIHTKSRAVGWRV